MIKLAHNTHLWAFLLLVVLIALYVIYVITRTKLIAGIGKSTLIKKLSSSASSFQKNIKFILALLALSFLIIAWANPLIGTKYESIKREGIDIIFAIDVSKSMDAKDVVPSRILRAKQIVSNTIDKMTNDRIGLIVFAGSAYLQMPVTIDYDGSKMYLKLINTDLVPKQGTSISDAVDLALESFDEESEGFKTLVIISDGEEHDGNANAAITKAKKQGVTVHTIGIGSNKGAPIPIDNNGNFKKNNNGEIIQTKLNESMLINLAQQGNGKYFNANQKNIEDRLLNAFAQQEGRLIGEKIFTSFKNQFPIFLIIALVILSVDFLISERRINLFGKSR